VGAGICPLVMVYLVVCMLYSKGKERKGKKVITNEQVENSKRELREERKQDLIEGDDPALLCLALALPRDCRQEAVESLIQEQDLLFEDLDDLQERTSKTKSKIAQYDRMIKLLTNG
jgi:hypothetical protein